MIQSPQINYVPQVQNVQNAYQQPAPVQPQNIQMPGYIYNYPSAGSYMPVQTAPQPLQNYMQPKDQFNGVNIAIQNPQGQGLGMPYRADYYANQALYPAGAPVQQPYIMPAQFYPLPQAPSAQTQPNMLMPPQNTQAAAVLPASNQQISEPVPPPPVITPAKNEAPAEKPVVDQPVKPSSSVNPESFAARLRTDDADVQKNTIEDIAEKVKNSDIDGPILLDTQIFDALVDIINKDTSSLQGPAPEAVDLRQKNPDELTEQEKAKAAPSPLEKAEINKQYALYTIAYMQDRLNNELIKRRGSALELKDLPCIDTIVDTAKSNPNPMLRIGALAALAHISQPEYKADLNTIFELAKSDEDERVRDAALKAAANLNKQ